MRCAQLEVPTTTAATEVADSRLASLLLPLPLPPPLLAGWLRFVVLDGSASESVVVELSNRLQ